MKRCLLTVLILVAWPAVGEEFFGQFSGELSFATNSSPSSRPTFILQEDFEFADPKGVLWRAPAGIEVDGASIPQFAWSAVGGPLSGKYLHASVIHDHYCDTKERSDRATHESFYFGMRAKGVSAAKAKLMYWAVRTFGPAWDIVTTQECQWIQGQQVCAPLTKIVERRTIDLANPFFLRWAQSLAFSLFPDAFPCPDCNDSVESRLNSALLMHSDTWDRFENDVSPAPSSQFNAQDLSLEEIDDLALQTRQLVFFGALARQE